MKTEQKNQLISLFFGGLLPVIAFTVIEEKYGVIYGLLAAMVFGIGEIFYEWIRFKKISQFTLIGNGLIIGLGLISLWASDGIWFKLQPALFEFGFFIFLVGSWWLGKPFLFLMTEKQNPTAPAALKELMKGMTFRLGLFFLVQSALATWAAFSWSTEMWAALKSVGLIVMLFLYMFVEIYLFRKKLKS